MAARSNRLSVALLCLSTLLFAALAVALFRWPAVDRLDVRAVAWVHRSAPEGVVDAMRVVTNLGSIALLAPLTAIAAFLLARAGRARAAIFVLLATLSGQVVDQALKASFRRTRPELDDPYVQLSSYAFPSGHAFGAAATYGALAFVLATAAARRRTSVAAFAAAAAIVLIVAASRVVLGVHYLLDVVAGIAGGIAVVSALGLAFHPSSASTRPAGHEHPQRVGLDPDP